MKFSKHIPNLITILRIVCSVILFFVEPLGASFLILYAVCGISDVLDGFIARKYNFATSSGALLDSFADAIFIFATIISILPALVFQWWILIWILAIALIRLLSLASGIVRFRAFAFLHTYLNKATGFLIFCFPYLFAFIGLNISSAVVCAFASISAIEELLINLLAPKLNRNITSILKIAKS